MAGLDLKREVLVVIFGFFIVKNKQNIVAGRLLVLDFRYTEGTGVWSGLTR
jgi:hypothetical protein